MSGVPIERGRAPKGSVPSFLRSDSCESTIENYEVVIVGGGLSGLTAAYGLLSKVPELGVVLLESEDRLGGRLAEMSMNARGGVPCRFEAGGQAYCDSQTHVSYLVKELGFTPQPMYSTGTKIGQARSGSFQRYSSGLPKLGNGLAQLDLKLFIARVDDMSVNLVKHRELDRKNTAVFINEQLNTTAAKDAVITVIRNTLGLEPSLLSAFYFLVFVNGTGGLYNLFNNRQYQIKEGTDALLEELDKQTMCTKLNERVLSIEQRRNRVILTSSTTQVYRCKYAIIAIPPAAVMNIIFEPCLPPERVRLLRQFIPGHISKFVTTYDKSFWRQTGDSGEVVGPGGPSTLCETDAIHMTFDTTSPEGHPAICGQLGGWPSIAWSTYVSDEERRMKRLEQLARYWGKVTLKPVDYKEYIWDNGGGGVTPGGMTQYALVDQPIGNIYWAGTEVSSRWPGYMNGAVHSGLKASLEVIMNLRPQSTTWRDFAVVGQKFPPTEHYEGTALASSAIKLGLKAALVASVGYVAWKVFKNWK